MPDLRLLRLEERQLSEAYPLVRSATHVDETSWIAFARRLILAGGGVLAVKAQDNCTYGVAAFRLLGTLRHGACLQVEIMVAFELSRHAPVRKALCAALEEIAREEECRAIVFTMAASSHANPFSASRISWERLGFQMETVAFVQELP
jgi:hypothetical protein